MRRAPTRRPRPCTKRSTGCRAAATARKLRPAARLRLAQVSSLRVVAAPNHIVHEIVVKIHEDEKRREKGRRAERARWTAVTWARDESRVEKLGRASKQKPSESEGRERQDTEPHAHGATERRRAF